MELVISGILWLLVISSAATINAWLGFLGLVFGEYRSVSPRPKFGSFYTTKQQEVRETWGSGDRSIAVAFAIFALVGIAIGLLCAVSGARKPYQPPKQVRVVGGGANPR